MPFLRGRGLELKVALFRACIAGLKAMRQECRRVKFMHTDPLMYRIARSPCDPRAVEWVTIFNQGKYEWLDMLMGRKFPELGGCSDNVDAIALNYYSHNQQDVCPCSNTPSGYHAERMPLDDHRRVPLSALLKEVYQRYGKDLVIGEFGHYIETEPFYRDQRIQFCKSVWDGIAEAASNGIPIRGACHYPVVDYEDWFAGFMHYSGIFDQHRRAYTELVESLVQNARRFITC
jgi:hypothetical protein